jgi:hypothetical protein
VQSSNTFWRDYCSDPTRCSSDTFRACFGSTMQRKDITNAATFGRPETPSQINVYTIINCVPTCGLHVGPAVIPRSRQLSARLDPIPGTMIWYSAVSSPRHSRLVVTTAVESLFSSSSSMKLLLWVWNSRRLSTLVHPQPYGSSLACCCTIFYASSMKVYKINRSSAIGVRARAIKQNVVPRKTPMGL